VTAVARSAPLSTVTCSGGGVVGKWPKCYFDHPGTVADELCDEFVADLSF
jgi:hypothetical protein